MGHNSARILRDLLESHMPQEDEQDTSTANGSESQKPPHRIQSAMVLFALEEALGAFVVLTCPLKTNLNLERESKDSGVCKEGGNDEEAIHERTDYPQAEGSRS